MNSLLDEVKLIVYKIYEITNKTAIEADLKSKEPLTYKPESLAPINELVTF